MAGEGLGDGVAGEAADGGDGGLSKDVGGYGVWSAVVADWLKEAFR